MNRFEVREVETRFGPRFSVYDNEKQGYMAFAGTRRIAHETDDRRTAEADAAWCNKHLDRSWGYGAVAARLTDAGFPAELPGRDWLCGVRVEADGRNVYVIGPRDAETEGFVHPSTPGWVVYVENLDADGAATGEGRSSGPLDDVALAVAWAIGELRKGQ